jgi:pyruvate/2-oxoglutarate dehydrogenase complex dihydrolipoamide acyltransferase (E2) component
VYRHYVDISVAVATPKGLLVPVIRNVEGMNYAHIEKELARLGELVCARFSNLGNRNFRRVTTKSP